MLTPKQLEALCAVGVAVCSALAVVGGALLVALL